MPKMLIGKVVGPQGIQGERGIQGEKGERGQDGNVVLNTLYPLTATDVSEIREIPDYIPSIPKEYFEHKYWALIIKNTTNVFRFVYSDQSELLLKLNDKQVFSMFAKDNSSIYSCKYEEGTGWSAISYASTASIDDYKGVLQCNHVIYDETTGKYVSPQYELKQTKGTTEDIASYKGKQGQIIINSDDNSIHVMDGEKLGGHKIKTVDMNYKDLTTTNKDIIGAINEVFQFANDTLSNMQELYTEAIVGRGGTVSKVGDVATVDEILSGIDSIPIGGGSVDDSDIKGKLLGVLYRILPSKSKSLNEKSTMDEIIDVFNLIDCASELKDEVITDVRETDFNCISDNVPQQNGINPRVQIEFI